MLTVWADQHTEACQDLVGPTITLVDSDADQRWALPAGWVRIVNGVHNDLVELLGTYEVERVTNKMSALRYAIRWPVDLDPEVRAAVDRRLAEAKLESLATCDLCAAPVVGQLSFAATRCETHPATGPDRVRGATARPPRWVPIAR